MKVLHILLKDLKTIDNEPGYCIFGVCNKFIRKLTDYSFTIHDGENAPLGNGTFFTALKENATLIKHFGPMYIDFDEYHPYSGAISEIFETNINAYIQCDRDYPY